MATCILLLIATATSIFSWSLEPKSLSQGLLEQLLNVVWIVRVKLELLNGSGSSDRGYASGRFDHRLYSINDGAVVVCDLASACVLSHVLLIQFLTSDEGDFNTLWDYHQIE